MIKFTEWIKLREMVGTGAIYNGEKAQDSKRDYNWWGDPASSAKISSQKSSTSVNRSGSPKKGK